MEEGGGYRELVLFQCAVQHQLKNENRLNLLSAKKKKEETGVFCDLPFPLG